MRSLSDLRFQANHQRSRWLIAGALAFVTTVTVLLQLSAIQNVKSELGETVLVLVATSDIEAGALVDDSSAGTESRPLSHVPEDALLQLPINARTQHPVSRGEILTTRRLTGFASGLVAAQIPAGMLGVAIPLDPVQLGVEPGDRIAIFRSTPGQAAVLVVDDSTVVTVGTDSLVAAVWPGDIGILLDGLVIGDVLTVLLPAQQN